MEDYMYEIRTELHNRFAPYWAILMVICLILGLLTINFKFGKIWNGYVLDVVGPAWTYILFRGLFTKKAENLWTKIFTPTKTFLLLTFVLFVIEFMQYFELYASTFDIFDLIAYVLLLLPIYILDYKICKKKI
jgi:O-antigen ligase